MSVVNTGYTPPVKHMTVKERLTSSVKDLLETATHLRDSGYPHEAASVTFAATMIEEAINVIEYIPYDDESDLHPATVAFRMAMNDEYQEMLDFQTELRHG